MNIIKHISGGSNHSCQSFDIYISEEVNGVFYFADALTLTKSDRFTYVEPSVRLSEEQAQKLTNDLWIAGYRPSSGAPSTGQIEATNKHLNDMRRIVESKLKVKF